MVSEYGLDWSAGVNYSCEKYTLGTSEHYYHADIDGGNITENAEFPIIDDWLGLYYGDYQTETADGAIVLRDMQSGETVPVLSRAETLDYSAIVGDILYYCPNFRNYRMNESGNIVSKNTLCGIDLSTGESFTVAKTAYMTDYAIVGDTAYWSFTASTTASTSSSRFTRTEKICTRRTTARESTSLNRTTHRPD